MKINRIIYTILKKEELSSLSLSRVQNKSTWEAGEILNRSHYKYLEIKTRAEKFFEVFILHYNTYGTLIPEGLKLNPDFKRYLLLGIEKRLSIKEIISNIENPEYKKRDTREALISKYIIQLRISKSIHAQNLYGLIMDFDKYNNFRILPRDVQEPSAFKRRNKTRFKKHLQISITLDPYPLHRIKELYENKSKTLKKDNEGYAILAHYPHSKGIIKINASQDNLKAFSSISLYVFKDKAEAKEYLDLVFEYWANKERNPKSGLIFWPMFRNMIKLAMNYDLINNIAPTRKGLQTALNDMDVLYAKRRNKDIYNRTLKELEK